MEQPRDERYPLPAIASLWRQNRVVPFLGAGASFVGAPPGATLPDAQAFARYLAQQSGYPGDPADPLTRVAQFAEDSAIGRESLLGYVSHEFDGVFDDVTSSVSKPYTCSLTRFLESIPEHIPKLIVSTNYDTIVERTLEREPFRSLGVRYFAMSHMMPGNAEFGRLLCYQSLADKPEKLVPSKVNALLRDVYKDHIIIYKMHGTSRYSGEPIAADSIVLTETDYVNFLAEDMLNRVPSTVIDTLRGSHLLFLGYSLEDWNFRVLLQRLRKLHTQQRPHWACRLYDENSQAGRLEKQFWDKRNVNLYNVDLGQFLTWLAGLIKPSA